MNIKNKFMSPDVLIHVVVFALQNLCCFYSARLDKKTSSNCFVSIYSQLFSIRIRIQFYVCVCVCVSPSQFFFSYKIWISYLHKTNSRKKSWLINRLIIWILIFKKRQKHGNKNVVKFRLHLIRCRSNIWTKQRSSNILK